LVGAMVAFLDFCIPSIMFNNVCKNNLSIIRK
jgi:hypothetical protein